MPEAYCGNTSVIRLRLKAYVGGEAIDTANVSMTITTLAGQPVGPQEWPLALRSSDDGQGDYVAELPPMCVRIGLSGIYQRGL
jgi:hypothetical protein